MSDINQMAARSGRQLKEDNTAINTAEMLEAIYKALIVDKDVVVNVEGVTVDTLTATTVGINSNINTTISALATGIKTVTATAAQLFAGASAKTNRRYIKIRNEDPVLRLRIGASNVSQQNGDPIEPGATVIIWFDPTIPVPIFGISEGASLKISITEG